MRKNKVFIAVLLVMTVLFTTFGSSLAIGDYTIITDKSSGVNVKILESNEDRTVMQFEVTGFNKQPVKIDGKEYYKISLPKEGLTLDTYEPELPVICRSIIIPDSANVDIKVLSSKYTDYKIPVAPSKGNLTRNINPLEVPYKFSKTYSLDTWYPKQLTELGEPYIMRDFRGIVVKLNAFQYQPATTTLRVYDSVTLEVYTNGTSDKNVFERTRDQLEISQDFNTIYESNFLNYELIKPDIFGEIKPIYPNRVKMLVIAHDDFYNAMTPFVNWKNQKGISTVMVKRSAVSATNNATQIRNYIQSYFSSHLSLTYVLLVGDIAQVASPQVGYDASDATYTKVLGSDNYPDIFVGRFSAESIEDVETQVKRSVDYEKYSTYGSTWFKKAAGIASAEGFDETDKEHMELIRNDLLGFTYSQVDQIYDPGALASTVTASLNDGRSFINYCGHGSTTSWSTTGFNSFNIRNLSNNGKLPFIFSVACVNGAFHEGTCFAETWLRSRDSYGRPIGAVGAYMSTINQPWVPPMVAQDEATDLLCSKRETTLGGLCYNGSVKMLNTTGYLGLDTFDHWVLFGDPSLQLRTDTPGIMPVSHAGSIYLYSKSYTVNTGTPGALCALSYGGSLLGYGYAGKDGKAVITLTKSIPNYNSLYPKTIKLTVSAFNKQTYFYNVRVYSQIYIDPNILLNEPVVINPVTLN